MGDADSNPRLILHNFISLDQCKELEFIHKSCATVGYRNNVFSTTLFHLIATNCPHFIIPFVPIRERLKEKAEEFFCCPYELCVEFTGLISWSKGASIGWHSDDNRPYLSQRHFTAVCYLNSYGKDFSGGLLRFQDGNPSVVVPTAGDVALYTADPKNIHRVDEIIEGERLALTLWFSRDSAHDEDSRLISLLSENILCCSDKMTEPKLPIVASSNMYWFPPDSVCQQSGFDICCARLHALGFDIYSSEVNSLFSDSPELLMEPLQLARGKELFEQKFVNILHALQVVQFFCWKVSEFINCQSEVDATSKVVQLSDSQREKISALKSWFLKDPQLADTVFSCMVWNEKCWDPFYWAKFCTSSAAFEVYLCKLHKQLETSLPYWRTEGMMYSVSFEGS